MRYEFDHTVHLNVTVTYNYMNVLFFLRNITFFVLHLITYYESIAVHGEQSIFLGGTRCKSFWGGSS